MLTTARFCGAPGLEYKWRKTIEKSRDGDQPGSSLGFPLNMTRLLLPARSPEIRSPVLSFIYRPRDDGNLYGTTLQGGAYGVGTIFEITTAGVLTPIHAFNHTDGAGPQSGVIEAGDGSFYGTTEGGGAHDDGTVFEFTGAGVLTTRHSFVGSDGSGPRGNVIQASNGNLYGTTAGGGAHGMGTVFEITPAGALTILHSFSGPDGAQPWAALVQATDGSFYGTTTFGGTSPGNGADGTVFRLDTGLTPFVRALPTYGIAGTEIGILGTDPTTATGVTFNSLAARFTVASPTEIVATIPIAATTGPVAVTFPAGTLTTIGTFQVVP